jgi:hypothetical protein
MPSRSHSCPLKILDHKARARFIQNEASLHDPNLYSEPNQTSALTEWPIILSTDRQTGVQRDEQHGLQYLSQLGQQLNPIRALSLTRIEEYGFLSCNVEPDVSVTHISYILAAAEKIKQEITVRRQ